DMFLRSRGTALRAFAHPTLADALNVAASLLRFFQLSWASMLASCARSRLWRPGALSEDTAASPLRFSHRRGERLRPSPGLKTTPPMRPTPFLLGSPPTNPTPGNEPTALRRRPPGFFSHAR